MSEFKKTTTVRLPFDLTDNDPNKNYGISSLGIWFILTGPKGAVQFAVNFPQYLPHVEERLKRNGSFAMMNEISGTDVGYHSPVPMYEDQRSMECELIEGGKCYYDGSGLRADEWVKEIFSLRGKRPEELIWEKLEQEYKERFE